jgi:preprotein translocase subunit SecB
MSEKQTSFLFQDFRILHSEINYADFGDTELDIDIEPKGSFNTKNKVYTLGLDIKVMDQMKNSIIEVVVESRFLFNEEFTGEIPNFFTLNAPAISFPYVRAYVAALSALSGIQTLNLPILNLVHLGDKLRSNFSVVDAGE